MTISKVKSGSLAVADLGAMGEKFSLYGEIRNQVGTLSDVLGDMNTLSTKIHIESGFEDLAKAVSEVVEPRP